MAFTADDPALPRSLVTDEAAARGILQIFEGEFQGRKLEMMQGVAA